MPDDIELMWIEWIVFAQPVSERGAEWLSRVFPQKEYWGMRLMSHDDVRGMAEAAQRLHLTIGGVSMPMSWGDVE
jgi:hypothetical protein